jgi:N-dimethylarginine dimethylaminohydrolase
MSRLPNKRKAEEPYAKEVLANLGFEILELPKEVEAFSGQGDSIACGDLLFAQSPYRTSIEAHPFIKEMLGYRVLSLRTKPSRWLKYGPAKLNKLTDWPDSPTYDIDLAIAQLKPPTETSKGLIAYCPEAFTKPSRKILADLDEVDKIIVSHKEALQAFALNLVSTGETVIMSSGAPQFKQEVERNGLKAVELDLVELKKGGGSIRCSSLTLDS